MEQVFRWKKKPKSGRHTFHYNGKKYQVLPGDVVEVPESALGGAIVKYDRLVPAAEIVKKVVVDDIPKKQLIIIQHGKSKSRFDIVNPDNPSKPLNDKPLVLSAAEKALGRMLASEDLSSMDWDALATFMEDKGIEIKDEYETEDDLRKAITEELK